MAKSRNSDNFLSQFKWGESYTSLFLGAVVVVVALILVFSFLRGRTAQNGETGPASTTETEESITGPGSYVVKEGDDLWTIAQQRYGSGYNWVDIASANKLENPDILSVGAKLTIPNVKPKTPTTQSAAQAVQTANPITGASYTVLTGDYLWDIAVRAYGDGYKWVEIAKVNKLSNPDVIHAGNVLKLPR